MSDVAATSVAPPSAPSDRPPVRKAPAAPVRRPSSAPVHLGAFALFAALCALFACRMIAGEDPALGLKPGVLATPAPPGVLRKVVLTRRIRVDGMTRAQMRRRGVDRIVVVRRRIAAQPASATVAGDGGDTPSQVQAVAVAAPGSTPHATRRAAGSRGTSTPAIEQPSSSAPPAQPVPVQATPDPSQADPAPAPAATPAPAPVTTATS